jgi:hypothetical protein
MSDTPNYETDRKYIRLKKKTEKLFQKYKLFGTIEYNYNEITKQYLNDQTTDEQKATATALIAHLTMHVFDVAKGAWLAEHNIIQSALAKEHVTKALESIELEDTLAVRRAELQKVRDAFTAEYQAAVKAAEKMLHEKLVAAGYNQNSEMIDRAFAEVYAHRRSLYNHTSKLGNDIGNLYKVSVEQELNAREVSKTIRKRVERILT